eukprot:m.98941 g.98941  ORF g.98941 m.98941 type:complete len:72 (+) comp15307_c0_seq2:1301-1516(+)
MLTSCSVAPVSFQTARTRPNRCTTGMPALLRTLLSQIKQPEVLRAPTFGPWLLAKIRWFEAQTGSPYGTEF